MTQLKEKALMLPQEPGVYIMKDRNGKVIYVGKAKCLPNRVSQYFSNLSSHNLKTRRMISQVNDFDYIIAGSEFEALTLENKLIKQHMPKYNILLKDDKGYPYIRLDTASQYPRLKVVSSPGKDKAAYFGPYSGRSMAKSIIDALTHILKLPSCTKVFPRDVGKTRPCINYDIGNCEGWCRGEPSAREYLKTMDQARSMLKGDYADLAGHIRRLMEEAAERLEFERAAALRDRYNAVLRLGDRQKMACGSLADMDAAAWSNGPDQGCFAVLHYSAGVPTGRDVLESENVLDESESAVTGQLLCRFYLSRGYAPPVILLAVEPEGKENIEKMLSQLGGGKVSITVPRRGDKLACVKLAGTNAREEAQKARGREEKRLKSLKALGEMLKLEGYPRRIEAYDISHTGGDGIIAAMTVFVSGKPLKRDYRLFKIKDLQGQDDYASIAQAVRRRFERMKEGSEGFCELPDLMLIDGGKGQTAAAAGSMAECGCHVPVFGMVKDDRHRTRALVSEAGDEISVSSIPAVFALVGSIQEETHRFAIESHRRARGKAVKTSSLTKIPGIGEATAAQLLRRFKSIKAVKGASYEELCEVVPKDRAGAVYAHYHSAEDERS